MMNESVGGFPRLRGGWCAWAFLWICALHPNALTAQDVAHERVLVLYSHGPNFGPFREFASGFRKELTTMSPAPVEFFEASLETARFPYTETEGPLADYLGALFRESGLDLVVTVGGPAARFSLSHRERLFPSTQLLMTAFDARILKSAPPPAGAAIVTVRFDLPRLVDDILQVLPDTTHVLVATGSASINQFWMEAANREFQRFAGQVRFTWLNELSLEELRRRVSDLPPGTAILYLGVGVDGAGVPRENEEVLVELHAATTAPIFGFLDTQLGRGIVGGRLIEVAEASRRTAETAFRILSGEAPESIEMEPLTAGPPVYDFRELERWDVPEDSLPPESKVLFRPPSLWERYRAPLVVGVSVVGLETALVAGLLLQRARRRRAEEEALALTHRLLTAQEDERSRLARELHDDVTQRLVRLSIDAAHVEQLLEATPDEKFARSMHEDAVRLSDDVHALSYRLHPSVLDDLGLAEALRSECDLFSRRESIRAELSALELPPELPKDRAICLFRIAQEALRNVARHARARRVDLSLMRMNGGVRMSVTDDGVGFNPARRRERPSLGFASMRERVRLVRGTLDIQSAPGRGTAVAVWVPLGVDAS